MTDPPAEPPEAYLARIEAQLDLTLWRCPHCSATLEPLAPTEGGTLARAVGISHQPGCPDYVDP